MSAQQKFDAAVRAYKARLEREAEERTRAEAERIFEEFEIPGYFRRLREVEWMLSSRAIA